MKSFLTSFRLSVLAAGLFVSALVSQARAQSALDDFDPNANDVVVALVVQPDGKILIGGDFTTLSPNGGATFTRNHIARLNQDGTLDTGFNPNVSSANSSVYSIALQADGHILVGGLFTSIGGQARSNIARLNPDGTVDLTFNPSATGTNSDVEKIVVQVDGKILVGGFFTTIGGQTRNNFARLDPTTGLADSFNPNPDDNVSAIAIQADGKILAGGRFFNIGGQARKHMARLDAGNGLADAFNPSPEGGVLSLAVRPDGKILVGGTFHSIGGRSREIFAQLDPATGLADSLDVAPDSNAQWVWDFAVQPDGRIVLGGEFFKIGFQTRNRVARIDPATNGLADSLAPNANSSIYAVAVQPDGKILLGGGFTSFAPAGESPVTRNRVARLQVVSPTPTPTPAPGTCGWTEAPRFPDRISGQALTSLNGYIYSFGGASNATPNCYKFDGTTWTPIAPLPIASGSVAAVNDGT